MVMAAVGPWSNTSLVSNVHGATGESKATSIEPMGGTTVPAGAMPLTAGPVRSMVKSVS